MKIFEFQNKIKCDECGEIKKVNKIILSKIDYDVNYLCDNCLQELNRKIVDHLAEKNL